MGLAGFIWYLLIGAGPGVVLYCSLVARKSFLVLLTLASAFLWLGTLLATAVLLRAFVPLPSSAGPFAAVLIVAVLVQEGARYGVWHLHKKTVAALEVASASMGGSKLTQADVLSLSLTHGLGHGLAHCTFFFLSWLPLTLQGGTLYLDTCPQMSVFLWLAICSMAFCLLHTFSMVIALDGHDRGDKLRAYGPSAAHMVAALLTLLNFSQGGCMYAAPLLVLGSVTTVALAGQVASERLRPLHVVAEEPS